MKNPVIRFFTLLILIISGIQTGLGQTICVPDSTVPNEPGVYPGEIEVQGCQPFDTTITFVFPRDTTVVFAGQTVTVDFIEFRIDSLVGLPDSVNWTCNLDPNCTYVVSPDSSEVDTIGCVRFQGFSDQPGLYNVKVHVTAIVDILGSINEQSDVFDAPLTVLPCPFVGDCYTAEFDGNCEPAIVTLTNNIPSNGQAGFDYEWSITGPLGVLYQTSDENPFPQILPQAGNYVIDYGATIDTTGFILNGLSIDAVGCDDLLDAGDIYWILIDPDGTEVINTSATPVSNGGNSLPISTGITGLLLDTGQYELQVWDNDLVGADDGCATGDNGSGASLFFNIPSAQTGSQVLVSGSLQVTMTLDNPIQTITCRDTFAIDPLPQIPELLADGSVIQTDSIVYCAGGSVLLSTSSTDSLIWFVDGTLQSDTLGDSLSIFTPGNIYLEAIDRQSLCRSGSPTVRVDSFIVYPPAIGLDSASEIFSILQPDDSVLYHWYDVDGNRVGSGTSYDPDSNGVYFASAVDTANFCESALSEGFNFISSIQEKRLFNSLELFPNPNIGRFNIRVELEQPSQIQTSVYDLSGRQLWRKDWGIQNGAFSASVEADNLPAGFYLFELKAGGQRVQKRLIVSP